MAIHMEESTVHCVSNKTGKNKKVQLSHQDYPRDTCQLHVHMRYFSFTFHMISHVPLCCYMVNISQQYN